MRRRAESDVHADVTRREIAAVGLDAPPQRGLAGALDPDARAHAESFPGVVSQPDLQPVVPRVGPIQQQSHGAVVRRDEHVDVAVVVDVAERRAAADLGAREAPGRAAALRLVEPAAPVLRKS